MSLTGHKDTGPVRVGIPIGDVVAGMWAAPGVQAAVIQGMATGRGPVVGGVGRAETFYGAFEAAAHKLESRLRRAQRPHRFYRYGADSGFANARSRAFDRGEQALAWRRTLNEFKGPTGLGQ